MLLRQAIYFIKVVECNSFTEAAEQCYISQSAISQQISALQKELGVKLLQREGRKLSLTASGEYFYKSAKALIDEVELMTKETSRIGKIFNDKISIGYDKSYNKNMLYEAINEFVQQCPNIEIEVVDAYSCNELYDLLKNAKVDIIIAERRNANLGENVVSSFLRDSKCFVVVSKQNVLAAATALTNTELEQQACVLWAQPAYHESESNYYRNVVEMKSRQIFADDIEKAGLLLFTGNAFLLVDEMQMEGKNLEDFFYAIPFCKNGRVNFVKGYHFFWNKENIKKNHLEKLVTLWQKIYNKTHIHKRSLSND